MEPTPEEDEEYVEPDEDVDLELPTLQDMKDTLGDISKREHFIADAESGTVETVTDEQDEVGYDYW